MLLGIVTYDLTIMISNWSNRHNCLKSSHTLSPVNIKLTTCFQNDTLENFNSNIRLIDLRSMLLNTKITIPPEIHVILILYTYKSIKKFFLIYIPLHSPILLLN